MCDGELDSADDLPYYVNSIWSMDKEFELPDLASLPLDRSSDPFVFWTPVPENPLSHEPFNTITEWREFVLSHNLHASIPAKIVEKFQLAQRVYFLAWIDGHLIKAGELVALTALEAALKSRYGTEMREKKLKEIIEQEKRGGKKKKIPANFPQLNALLDHMVRSDGLAYGKIPMIKKYGIKTMEDPDKAKTSRTVRKRMPEGPMILSRIRNSLAHGNPLDCMPWGGLLELVHDLIEYAYRDWIAEEPVGRSVEEVFSHCSDH